MLAVLVAETLSPETSMRDPKQKSQLDPESSQAALGSFAMVFAIKMGSVSPSDHENRTVNLCLNCAQASHLGRRYSALGQSPEPR